MSSFAPNTNVGGGWGGGALALVTYQIMLRLTLYLQMNHELKSTFLSPLNYDYNHPLNTFTDRTLFKLFDIFHFLEVSK